MGIINTAEDIKIQISSFSELGHPFSGKTVIKSFSLIGILNTI